MSIVVKLAVPTERDCLSLARSS